MIEIQDNINKIPIPTPQSISRPSEQEEISEESQNIENINGQDYITEVLNISKIKEGFYIGDRISAISIEVVVQFKLTHMINASGNQIINQWETIGMKYLTLNWAESPNQNLFDQDDEIAEKILYFIDDSFINGEGILAHSFKGQNRVCIVVLIYLMKKYKWSLKKSMEYLKSKKQDVNIPPFFLSQLIKFETRLLKKGELTKDTPWSFENLKDPEEKLLRNTYINGTNKNKINRSTLNENKGNIRHIIWADYSDPNQQIPISVINLEQDLFLKKNIRSIFVHKQIKPAKPCIKITQNKFIMKYSSNKNMNKEAENQNKVNRSTVINNTINNLIKSSMINNTSNIILSGNKSYNDINKKENINKLYNSISSNNNKKNNNYILNKNIEELETKNSNNINILKVPNRKGIIISNNILRTSNNKENIISNNQMKNSITSTKSDSIQINTQQNQNNFYINSYNLSNGNKNYSEIIKPNIRMNSYNKNENDERIQISKFTENEINSFKIYDEKGNNIGAQINMKHRRKDHSYKRRDEKKENIIIIANKCDNIIRNNINNYYINQIGTVNNNINNNINNNGNNINNNQLTNNYIFKNNSFNNSYNNKEPKINNNNKIIPIYNNNNNINNMKKKSIKKKNEFDEIDIKEFNNKIYNSNNNSKKVSKDNVKNIIGNNHRQILGINNTENNYIYIAQNQVINDMESNISPKNERKIINLTNNTNGKRFKIMENTNLKNYKSDDNFLNKKRNFINNNNSNNNINNNNSNLINNRIKNMNYMLDDNQKLNRNNHNFNIIITTEKNIKNTQTSPNSFLNRRSPKNININMQSNLDKYDPIISNYNPIKKNNRLNRSIPNSKNKNYNTDFDNNFNMNINNYSISSNKPLNNFNPNLIKRKGTPTAGHQSIKINNINNNPIRIKNNIITNNKKPSTPDVIINKSSTMMNNNFQIDSRINNNKLVSNNSSINLNKNDYFNNNSMNWYKSKKIRNYNSNINNINNLPRPATAPHKDNNEKPMKDKRRKQIIHHIHETKKGINNYNKNALKLNQRPSSAGQGKYNNSNNIINKENKENDNIKYNNNNNSNIIHIGHKIEIDFSKYKTSIGKRRLGSPPVMSNNKINLGNNNIKYNFAKHRLPSPMIKSTDINGKSLISTINKSNTSNFTNVNKNSSFSLK